jgi:hypothetical protein
MKPTGFSEPARWRDGEADRPALESRAGALADAARRSLPLTPEAVARIRNEVRARRSDARGRGVAWWLPLRTKPMFVAALLLVVSATTAVGAGVLWRRHVDAVRPAAPPADDRPARRIAHPPARLSQAPSVAEPPAPVPLPTLEEPPTPTPTPVAAPRERAARREPPPFSPVTAVTSAPRVPESEAAIVSAALFELRQRRDARAALSALDRHARAFPHGVLEAEALRTRIEATLQLGDLKAALALLDGTPATGDVLGAELLLTRAELRAAAGRFREALADFTELVDGGAGALAPGGDERALYGRAVCLGHVGEHEQRARAALNAYRRRFPNGRFIAEVERLLAAPPPESHP